MCPFFKCCFQVAVSSSHDSGREETCGGLARPRQDCCRHATTPKRQGCQTHTHTSGTIWLFLRHKGAVDTKKILQREQPFEEAEQRAKQEMERKHEAVIAREETDIFYMVTRNYLFQCQLGRCVGISENLFKQCIWPIPPWRRLWSRWSLPMQTRPSWRWTRIIFFSSCCSSSFVVVAVVAAGAGGGGCCWTSAAIESFEILIF